MQTFLLLDTFEKSLSVLDNRRLFKQVVESGQILNVIKKIKESPNEKIGWQNHPATNMWKKYPDALTLYYNITEILLMSCDQRWCKDYTCGVCQFDKDCEISCKIVSGGLIIGFLIVFFCIYYLAPSKEQIQRWEIENKQIEKIAQQTLDKTVGQTVQSLNRIDARTIKLKTVDGAELTFYSTNPSKHVSVLEVKTND